MAPNVDDLLVPRYREQFTKLVLWNMTSFERILYMDSDTLAVGDVSPMLTEPSSAFAQFMIGNLERKQMPSTWGLLL